VQAGVDDLHTGVAQSPSNDLRATVVPVKSRLGDNHSDSSTHRAQSSSRTSRIDNLW
jgi:hypothetical protein